jgi:hypothetical protein
MDSTLCEPRNHISASEKNGEHIDLPASDVHGWYLAGKMCTPRCRKLCWGNRTRLELILLVLVVLLVGCNAACALPACLGCWPRHRPLPASTAGALPSRFA